LQPCADAGLGEHHVQRADLNALEEALGYQQLIDEFAYTQVALADVIGKSRPHVANTLRLLKLPESVKAHLREGRLTAGHARALVNVDDPEAVAARRGSKSLRTAPIRRIPAVWNWRFIASISPGGVWSKRTTAIVAPTDRPMMIGSVTARTGGASTMVRSN